DALAHHRRALGLPALSINWGPWREIGHAATEYGARAHAQLARLGVRALPPDAGLHALETLMTSGVTQAAALDIDWPSFFERDPAARRLRLLEPLLPSAKHARTAAPLVPAAGELADAVRARPRA